MNTSILVKSLHYIDSTFQNLVQLSSWIYQELQVINYTDTKLSKAMSYDFDIAESIIHLNINKDILNNLLSEVLNKYYINNFYIRTKLLLDHGATDIHLKDEYIY